MGDIHQPLHISYQDDRGGNRIDADDLCFDDLHATWDTCLVVDGIGSNVRVVADDLRLNDLDDTKRENWSKSAAVDWANESYLISISPDVRYCTWKQGSCWYSPGQKEYSGTPRTVQIDTGYKNTHVPIVRERLLQAGVRLGHLLDTLLGN
jgi:hypothetical protein